MNALPIVEYEGQAYYLDERLRELRPVAAPYRRVALTDDIKHALLIREIIRRTAAEAASK